MPEYAMDSFALPAVSLSAKVKVASSFSLSRVMVACCSLPPAVTVTLFKSSATAFSVMRFVGSARITSMVSMPVKVAAFRSGVSVSV